jgi:dTDP-4-amino-4,6-dideoxygalactose transaminase
MTVLAQTFKGDPSMPVPVPFLDLAAMHAELREDLDKAWHHTVHGSGFVGGAAVEQFEGEWAAYCSAKYAIGVANGTDALVLALRGLGIGPGDEVIVPANTFVATAEAVVLVGAVPRFIDVDPDTLLMTAAHMEAAITPRTTAVIVVHLYGQMPNMDAITASARRAGLAIIEDAAQAHGATWHNRRAGSFGDAATFSFYPGKNLGAFGDAGAVVTSDPDLADRIRSTGDHGRRLGHKYVHDISGTNSRLDSLQAAVLSVKLRRLSAWNAARRAAMRQYAGRLAGTDATLVRVADGARSVHHLAVVQVDDRDEVATRMERCGISTGVHYPVPCHEQIAFAEYARERLPVCEESSKRILSLPLFPTISRAQIDWVCAAVTTPLLLMSEGRRTTTLVDLEELGHVG